MSLKELVDKYISSAESVLSTIAKPQSSTQFDQKNIDGVIESAKAYLEDAKHYRNEGMLEVSLTSVAYCEGLVDTLRMLGFVEFEWPKRISKSQKK